VASLYPESFGWKLGTCTEKLGKTDDDKYGQPSIADGIIQSLRFIVDPLAVLFQCVSEKKSHKFLREEEIQVK
jgi:hypothetical protein